MQYRFHLFCCTNKRPEGHERGCCLDRGGGTIRDYLKKRVKELGIEGVRVNAAGCLDHCEAGPVVVIYPEGVWYTLATIEDAERVIQEHLLGGRSVAALEMAAP